MYTNRLAGHALRAAILPRWPQVGSLLAFPLSTPFNSPILWPFLARQMMLLGLYVAEHGTSSDPSPS